MPRTNLAVAVVAGACVAAVTLHMVATDRDPAAAAALASIAVSILLFVPMLVPLWRDVSLRVLVVLASPLAVYGLVTIDASTVKYSFYEAAVARLDLPAIAGLNVESNTLGLLVAPGVVVSLALALSAHHRNGRVGFLLLALFYAAVTALSGSKTAAAEAIMSTIVMIAATRPRGRVRMASGIILVAAIVGGATAVLHSDDQNLTDRYRIWSVSINEFASNLPMGPGFGAFARTQSSEQPLLQISQAGRTYSRPLTAHNLMLQTLLDLGVLGLIPLLAALSYGLVRNIGLIRHSEGANKLEGALALGWLAGLVTAGLTESVLTTTVRLADGPLTMFVPVPFVTLLYSITTGSGLDRHARERSE